MKIIPKYSYEYNTVLNEGFNENELIQNFASLLSDKERFLALLPMISKNEKLIQEGLGFDLLDAIPFYVVRAEKFKSFSEPITIEYSILPEEMLVFLLKEIVNVSIKLRFQDELQKEQHINSFVDYVCVNGDWGDRDLVKFGRNIHDDSQKKIKEYKLIDIDFSEKNMKDRIEELYDE